MELKGGDHVVRLDSTKQLHTPHKRRQVGSRPRFCSLGPCLVGFHPQNWSHITDTCWPLDFLLFPVFVPNLADTGIKETNTNWVLQSDWSWKLRHWVRAGGNIVNRL